MVLWSVHGRVKKISRCFGIESLKISQNVLAVCDFDMMFTFVCSVWEGSAHDSCVFYDAITRQENGFPLPPDGTLNESLI